MDTKLTLQQRRDEFAKLFDLIPGSDTGEKLGWLVDNDLCSRQTARTWNMRNGSKPPPASKLRLMARLIKK